jgi:hypothetical protein
VQQGCVGRVGTHGDLINRRHTYHSVQLLKQGPKLLLLLPLLLLLLLLLPCSASM